MPDSAVWIAPDPLGTHRVLEPLGALPQSALRLDPRPQIAPTELLIAVDTLNLDAASFLQLRQECTDDAHAIARRVAEIVEERGKMHNPVTGSGGVLCGTVIAVGPEHPRASEMRTLLTKAATTRSPAPRVASLVSLTLTPLRLMEVGAVDLASPQIPVRGTAVLFASTAFAVLPDDLPESLALAVLDVAGAPAYVDRFAGEGDMVLILGGGGRAGLLCQEVATRKTGSDGLVVAWCHPAEAGERARKLAAATATGGGGFDRGPTAPTMVLEGDATRALDTLGSLTRATGGRPADLTVNCVSAPGTEMASILGTRDGGTVVFFGMATDFARATLGAEGVGKDVTLIMGNGYSPGHADAALDLVRSSPALRDLLAG